MLVIPLLAVLCSLLGSSCRQTTVCHVYHSLPERGWSRGDTLTFRIDLPDSGGVCYRMFVDVRNRNDFPHPDLLLCLQMSRDETETYRSSTEILPHFIDTLRLALANERGVWTGKGWGGLYQNRFYAGTVCTDRAGAFTLKMVYAHSDTLLRGVNDVGIRIEKLSLRPRDDE